MATEAIPDPFHIQLTGTEHRWRVSYPGMGAAADRLSRGPDLHLPVDANVVIVLKSTDYIYTVSIPDLGLKEIAVPDLEFRLEFRSTKVGVYDLIGEEMCGEPGREGPGRLIVEPRERFLARISPEQ
jgi:cytochrome c oxidase subunit 2